MRNSNTLVTAVCGDLMLAKECVADLKTAGFGGEVSVEPIDATDALHGDLFQPYGSSGGRAAGRGAILGALAGAIVGCMLATLARAEPAFVGLAGVCLGTGVGGCVGWAITNGYRSRKGSPHDRFLLRCTGTDDDVIMAHAKGWLGTSSGLGQPSHSA